MTNETVTTVPAQPHSIADTRFAISDIQVLLAILVAFAVIGGFILAFQGRVSSKKEKKIEEDQKKADDKRKEDQEDATARTKLIMDSIEKSHKDSARDVRELTDKVKDGKTIIDKEIERVASVTKHDIANLATKIQALIQFGERAADETAKIRERTTILEEKSRNQDYALNELKQFVREKFDETKDLIKEQGDRHEAQSKIQGDRHEAQFKELSLSIREARDAKFKP